MKNFVLSLTAVALLMGTSTSGWAAYTDKSYHSNKGHHYKNEQGSYSSPFDYGAKDDEKPRIIDQSSKCNIFTFDARKSYDVDRQKLSYTWDFGDGNTSAEPVVQHAYDKAGEYKVTLTVRDDSGQVCDSGITSTNVVANFPPTAEAGEDKTACLGESLSFDGSKSSSSGTATYLWDFGDGHSGDGMTTSHTYEKSGKYRVRLTVDDGKKSECSTAYDSMTVEIHDRAGVELSGVQSVCMGNSARFTATGSGGVSKYSWDFGDGAVVEAGSSVNHVYSKSGTFTVRVTADNGRGTACSVASSSHTLEVNAPPTAHAGENLACCTGEPTSFDASKSSSPDGRPLSYHWDFGDGQRGEGERVSHSYEKGGNYRVVLTVKDDSGSNCSMAQDSFVANVNTKPEPVIEVK